VLSTFDVLLTHKDDSLNVIANPHVAFVQVVARRTEGVAHLEGEMINREVSAIIGGHVFLGDYLGVRRGLGEVKKVCHGHRLLRKSAEEQLLGGSATIRVKYGESWTRRS